MLRGYFTVLFSHPIGRRAVCEKQRDLGHKGLVSSSLIPNVVEPLLNAIICIPKPLDAIGVCSTIIS
jgi:hypothetical protein